MYTASDELLVYSRRLMNEVHIQFWCALDFCISGDNLEVIDYVILSVPLISRAWAHFLSPPCDYAQQDILRWFDSELQRIALFWKSGFHYSPETELTVVHCSIKMETGAFC